MKSCKLLFYFLSVFCCSVSAQRVDSKIFHEIKNDSSKLIISNLLVVGIGSTASRIFLDNLSEKLISSLSDKKINVAYQYLGKNITEAKERYDTLHKDGYDAFLVFTPKDSSFFGAKSSERYPLDPTILIPSIFPGLPYQPGLNSHEKVSTIVYHQDFYVQLFNATDKKKSVWAAIMNADGDLRSKKIYKNLSASIINCFKKYKYL